MINFTTYFNNFVFEFSFFPNQFRKPPLRILTAASAKISSGGVTFAPSSSLQVFPPESTRAPSRCNKLKLSGMIFTC